ncbi:hypothetical protein UlMin_021295 [Ulmus minor]
MEEVVVEVVIVGGGPAGIATSVCLNHLKISNIVLEREDCCASFWKKRAYDRLKLHLAKQYCQLPHMPFPQEAPTFIPKNEFIRYLDEYVLCFDVILRWNRNVESAFYDSNSSKWSVVTRNTILEVYEVYFAKFFVVASGENSQSYSLWDRYPYLGTLYYLNDSCTYEFSHHYVPQIHGLDGFGGTLMHSSLYQNGKQFSGKNVLVVGIGNSGAEIAYDLSNWGARTSIVARSGVHFLTEEIVKLGMFLLKYLPTKLVDMIVLNLGKLKHGDMSKYGLKRPKEGPFFLKQTTGRSTTIDVGCIEKIRSGEIKVLPPITTIEGNTINFENGETHHFDDIIFATGYRSNVKTWLKDYKALFNDEGMPKQRFFESKYYWRGENGLYCTGFSQRGLLGISEDAKSIANHISFILKTSNSD